MVWGLSDSAHCKHEEKNDEEEGKEPAGHREIDERG